MRSLLDFLLRRKDPLADYEFIEPIAEGGMGKVWKVEHTPSEQIYALKLMHPGTEETREKFREIFSTDEGEVALQLDHPNVVTTYDYGETKDSYYVLMEYIDGPTVSAIMRRKPRRLQKYRFRIVVECGRGLAHLHDCGLVHRDFSPKNMLFSSDKHVKLIDFGLAIPQASNDTGVDMSGTASYMAPEQIRRTGVDVRTDIYAFGVSAFEILTGERPFPTSSSRDKKLSNHLNTEPRTMSDMDDSLTDELDEVISKCMQKDPEDRYDTMQRALRDLVQAIRNARN